MNFLSNKTTLIRLSVFACALIVVVFTGIYFTNKLLKEDEMTSVVPTAQTTNSVQLTGTVMFIDPRNYPSEDVSFYLADKDGKRIILLSSTDDKLTVVEGLTLNVKGMKYMSKDGKNEILKVEEIIVNANN